MTELEREMLEALRPFAIAASVGTDGDFGGATDEAIVVVVQGSSDGSLPRIAITVGDLRAARGVIAKAEANEPA